MSNQDDWEGFSRVARSMSMAFGVADTLESAAAGAVEIIPHAVHAGISMVYQDQPIETQAATDQLVRRGDELQYELNDGPCLQSIYQQETVQSDDLTRETRWPEWSRRVASELGVRSMLCFQLFISEDSLGALNLYAEDVAAFDEVDRSTGLALAAHIAVALASAQHYETLQAAIISRTVIGQAEGMLMQRYGLDAAQSFAVLTRMSQHAHRRLRDVAADLVRDGITPDVAANRDLG